MSETPLPGERPEGARGRLLAIDALRGATIAGMILVNNPGSWAHVYAPLAHAPWHGWTPTDLVFPFFLFVVGVSIPFSFSNRLASGESRGRILAHALRRAATLVALGLVLHAIPDFDLAKIRIPGVLQRIGVVYALAAPLVLATTVRGQALAAALVLLGYWALLALVPVPGHGAGVLEKEGNLAAWIDLALLRGHLYEPAWDPEGIASTLPATATTLLGALAGAWLRSARGASAKATGLLAAGSAAALLGLFWDRAFPINKNLWTSSYAVFTAGLASVALGLCLFLTESRGLRAWAKPFAVFGTNSIAAFVASGLGARAMRLVAWSDASGETATLKGWIWKGLFAPLAEPRTASLLFALAYLFFWFAAFVPLYRRRIFLKI